MKYMYWFALISIGLTVLSLGLETWYLKMIGVFSLAVGFFGLFINYCFDCVKSATHKN